MQKKWLLVGLAVIFIAVLVGASWLYNLNIDTRKSTPDSSIYGTLRIDLNLPNVYLHCQIQSDEINPEIDLLGSELVILRTVPCTYQGENGDNKSVDVPLAYFNSKLNQYYSLNSIVNDLGMPGNAYIDDSVERLVTYPAKNPIVSLEANSDPSRNIPKLAKFIAKTNEALQPNWARLFAQSDDEKYLPETESGRRIFFATNLTYIVK